MDKIDKAYPLAKECYAELNVDTEAVIGLLETVSISLHCWQGDDVGGFEKVETVLSGGGIQATGNYPGRARTADELRSDLDKALRLIPETQRSSLPARVACAVQFAATGSTSTPNVRGACGVSPTIRGVAVHSAAIRAMPPEGSYFRPA